MQDGSQQPDAAALRRQLAYITDGELFALLGISTGTGRNRRVAGTLPPHYKIGREKLFKLAKRAIAAVGTDIRRAALGHGGESADDVLVAAQAQIEAISSDLLRPRWNLPAPIEEAEFVAASLTPACIVDDYLFADVAVLVAPGGTGKTTLVLFEAVHIVLGLPLFGIEVRKPGPVLILTAEDSREMLVARLRQIARALDLTQEQRATIRRDVRISDVSDEGLKLTVIAGDVVVPGRAIDTIIRRARPLTPVLVTIDPAVSFGVGEARVNDAEQGLVDAARRIRRELACCVRYVHHTESSTPSTRRPTNTPAAAARRCRMARGWSPSCSR